MKKILRLFICLILISTGNVVTAENVDRDDSPFRAYCPQEIYCGRDDDLTSCFPINDDAGGYLTNISSGIARKGKYFFYRAETEFGAITERIFCKYYANDTYEPIYTNFVTLTNLYNVNFQVDLEAVTSWENNGYHSYKCDATSSKMCPFVEVDELFIRTEDFLSPRDTFSFSVKIDGNIIDEKLEYFLLTNDVKIYCKQEYECGVDVAASKDRSYYYELGTVYFDVTNRMRITRIESTGNIAPFDIIKHPTLNTIIIINKTAH